jgi:DNA repair protein RadC
METHNGHRKRLKESFKTIGLSNMPEHAVLEMLLTYAIPRIDVNPVAHELIDKFGSLEKIFDTPIEQLTTVNHVSEHVAILLHLIPQLAKAYYEKHPNDSSRLNSAESLVKYMTPLFTNEVNEVFYALCFDTNYNLIKALRHSEGTKEKAGIDIRSLTTDILDTKCCTVVLAHNHLGKSAEPSASDIIATKQIASALSPLNIIVSDHIIISKNGFFSFRSCNLSGCLFNE